MSGEAWTAIGVAVSAIAASISALGVARINSTKHDVGEAKQQAAEANSAAVEARELARPTGNGYADRTISALDRIERRIEELGARQVRTNAWLMRHLADHAAGDITRRHDTDPTDDPREGP